MKNAVTNEIKRDELSVPPIQPSEGGTGGEVPGETPQSGESTSGEGAEAGAPSEGESGAGNAGESQENEQKELLYTVTAQIIVYLTNVVEEG